MPPTAFLHPFARAAADAGALPVDRARARGRWCTNADGRAYVDGMGSLWYANVGHGRAEIADAVAEQLRTLAAYHTFDRFTNEPTERLWRRCSSSAATSLTPGSFSPAAARRRWRLGAQARPPHPRAAGPAGADGW